MFVLVDQLLFELEYRRRVSYGQNSLISEQKRQCSSDLITLGTVVCNGESKILFILHIFFIFLSLSRPGRIENLFI